MVVIKARKKNLCGNIKIIAKDRKKLKDYKRQINKWSGGKSEEEPEALFLVILGTNSKYVRTFEIDKAKQSFRTKITLVTGICYKTS